MNKKYLIIGAVLVLLLILAAAVYLSGPKTPRGSDQKVELTWWKTFESAENIQDLISDYQALHKNVTINYVKKDINDYENELVDALASNKGPDIFTIHNDWLPKHKEKIFPMPSTQMSTRTYRETFLDVAASDFMEDDKIYALPLAVDVLALYYNKDILGSAGISQPPSTWPELVSDSQKVTKFSKPGIFSKSGIAMGTASNVNRAVDILNLLMLQNGTKFYSDDKNSALFAQPISLPDSSEQFNPGEVALAFYTQFSDPAKTSYTWNSKSDLSVDAFAQGKAAMMLSYAYMLPIIRDRAPNLNWAVAAVPQTTPDASKVNFANYWGETVSKSSKNASVAWDFLNFITSRQELEKYYAKHKQVSSRKDLLPSQYQDNDIGVFAENALTAKSVYKKDPDLFEGAFLKSIDDVVLKNFSAGDAISNAAQQINLSLQQK